MRTRLSVFAGWLLPFLVTSLVAAACGGGGSSGPADAGIDAPLVGFARPDLVCPGDPACASDGDGVLKVGAAARAYTPDVVETWTDENGDHEWQSTEPYVDANHNGTFDGYWLFGGGRAAEGVTTDVEARAIAFVEGDTTVVVVYCDALGLLLGDIDSIRTNPILAGVDIDHIVVGSTHAHDVPDTIGLWGPSELETGRRADYMQRLSDQAAEAIKAAVESAVPATMVIATTPLLNDLVRPEAGTNHWNGDFRDPIIYDPTLTVARFVKASAPTETIGTIVNWGDHPEVAHFSDDAPTITAHFPHWLRDAVEQGVKVGEAEGLAADLPGLGGVTVYVQGAIGGQVGSIRDTMIPGPDGTPVLEDSHAKDQAIGVNVARRALEILRDEGETISDLPLTVRSAEFHAQLQNTLFQFAFIVGLVGPHPLVGYDPDQQIERGNEPWLTMRSTYVQVGPLALVTVPGELHPELWVGGYDGSWSWGHAMIDTTKPNSANLADAPAGPYMRDLVLANPGVRYPICAGLAEDFIGYIVPAYNYVLNPSDPYVSEAEGDHYEEVFSLGPNVEEHAIYPILQLLQFRP